MSILAAAAAAATTQPDVSANQQFAWAVAFLLWGVGTAYILGAFRARSLAAPARPAPESNLGAVFLLLAVAVFAWLGSQMVYFNAIRDRLPTKAGGGFDVSMFEPADMAFLGTVPALLGLVVLLIGDRLANPALPRELGSTLDRIPGALWRGLLAMVCVMPLMLGAGILLQMLYSAVGYVHPSEHEMLTVLGKTRDTVTKVIIVGGATLLVPVFEEFLFRGHLQTVLVRLFSPRPPQPAEAQTHGFPVVQSEPIQSDAAGAVAVLDVPAIVPPVPASEVVRGPAPSAKWAAIAVTSLVFAVLHPGWTWPLIFLLSLALGYAYERTGNLWVPIVMHLSFNSVQTAIFLASRTL